MDARKDRDSAMSGSNEHLTVVPRFVHDKKKDDELGFYIIKKPMETRPKADEKETRME
jgi:hypothetical protein